MVHRRGTRLAGTVLVTVAVYLLGAAPAFAASVAVADFHFSPATVTIKAGDTVTWTSNGPSPHTVTADGGAFDSGNLDPGQSFSHTFATAGTFGYHCQYHQLQGMIGTVVVQAAATQPPPPPPTTGGGSGSTPTPLPNTGLGTGWLVAGVLGIALMLAGAIVLFGPYRRRA